MIGQKELIQEIDSLIANDKFPKFSIIVGPKGSGKTLLVEHIHSTFSKGIALNLGTSVSDVRQAISQSQTVKGDIVFCVFNHADSMSVQAKNALLKIVEEPPANVYFIMTLESLSNTLDTIRSRATVYQMLPYTPTEIGQLIASHHPHSDEMGILVNLCEVPGEVEELCTAGVIKFYEYVKSVVDYIAEVSGANCFKIANKIKLSDKDAAGYDLRLFFKAFMTECSNRLLEDTIRYASAIKITSKYLQDLNINGVSKSSLFDMWILDIRKAWM